MHHAIQKAHHAQGRRIAAVFCVVLLASFLANPAHADAWRFDVSPKSLSKVVESAASPWHEKPELLDVIDLTKKKPEPLTALAKASRAVAVSDAIVDTLKAVGYYDAHVTVTPAGEGMAVTVSAGEPVLVDTVSLQWQGEVELDDDFKPPTFPLARGDVLDQSAYSDFKQAVDSLALSRGYYAGHWRTQRITLDLFTRRADITLVYERGPRAHFGELKFIDQEGRTLSELEPKWLSTLTPFKPGDPISSKHLVALQKNLLDTRYFQDVRVDLQDENAEGRRSVLVQVDTREPSKMSVGLGYATDVGPRLSLHWQRPRLNPQGHGIEASSEVSVVRQQAEVRYRIPYKHPIEDTIQLLAGVLRDDIDNTKTTQTVLGVQRVIAPTNGWQRTYGLRLSEERYHRESGEADAQQFLVPSVSLSKLHSRGGLDPISGFRQQYQIETAHTSFFSDADYVLLRANWRWLTTVAQRHMLLTRVELGHILSPNFQDLPPSTRFYAGGDNSVRGFDYRSLSPTNAQNETIGGQNLVVGSFEYAWRWLPTWRPAVFVDAGNAFTGGWQPVKLGAGVGIRWISPVGPVRFDIASAISEPGKPLRVHLTLGTAL
ncbi:MAG: autotransporter assembly complex family protein [Paraperlucidibaca sp.]